MASYLQLSSSAAAPCTSKSTSSTPLASSSGRTFSWPLHCARRAHPAALEAVRGWHAAPTSTSASPSTRNSWRQCSRAVPLGVVADLALEPATLILPALAAAGGVAALRFYLYSQLEYITASMLTKYVPRGSATANGKGATVIQLGGGTRELFYYPKDTIMVTAVGEKLNKGLLEQAGVTAAVPTLVKTQPITDLSFQADASVDAVVSLCALGQLQPMERAKAVREAQRVLRPGRPLIFLEKLREGGSPLRPLLGGDAGSLTAAELGALLPTAGSGAGSGAFEYVEWSPALEGQNPHAVGVAVRGESGPGRTREERAAAREQEISSRRKGAAAPKTKGFTG